MKRFSKKLIVTAAVAAVAMGAGVAFAAWTAGGTGNAYAKATTAQALTTVDVSADTTGQLYPGGSGDVMIKIHNPNAYPVTVASVSLTPEDSVTHLPKIATTPTTAACDASTGVTFTDQTGLSLVVGAGADLAHTFIGAAHMSNASDNACQGKVFSIPVTLAGASSAS